MTVIWIVIVTYMMIVSDSEEHIENISEFSIVNNSSSNIGPDKDLLHNRYTVYEIGQGKSALL